MSTEAETITEIDPITGEKVTFTREPVHSDGRYLEIYCESLAVGWFWRVRDADGEALYDDEETYVSLVDAEAAATEAEPGLPVHHELIGVL